MAHSFVAAVLLAALQEASDSYQLAFRAFLGIALCAFVLSFAVNEPKGA